MSLIDTYKHENLGVIYCPIEPEYHLRSGVFLYIPIYRINVDALQENPSQFQAKAGDVLVGGGSGEAQVFRLSIPEAFYYHTHTDWDKVGFEYDSLDKVQKTYWSATNAYLFGFGYTKLGWSSNKNIIEDWLAGHLVTFLAQNFTDQYSAFIGEIELEQDGSICRMLTSEENKRL